MQKPQVNTCGFATRKRKKDENEALKTKFSS